MNKESKRLSLGLSLLVVFAILVSVTPVFAGVPAYQPDSVDFTASPTSGYAPLTVDFTDMTDWSPGCLPSVFGISALIEGRTSVSNAIDSYCEEWRGTWDFGDGKTESRTFSYEPTAFNVSHVYTEPGTYTVSLTWKCAEYLTAGALMPIFGPHNQASQATNGDSFTKTIEFYIEVLAPPEKKTKRPPEPANLSLSNLVVSPTEVLPTQEVVITATVCNSGELTGTMSVDLLINGVAEQSQTVGVSGGSCQSVTFNVARTHPGTYEVAVDGMPGQFSVIAPTNVPEIKVQNVPPQETGGIGTAGIIAIVAVLIVLIAAIFVILRKP